MTDMQANINLNRLVTHSVRIQIIRNDGLLLRSNKKRGPFRGRLTREHPTCFHTSNRIEAQIYAPLRMTL